jgi:hypothetical protein
VKDYTAVEFVDEMQAVAVCIVDIGFRVLAVLMRRLVAADSAIVVLEGLLGVAEMGNLGELWVFVTGRSFVAETELLEVDQEVAELDIGTVVVVVAARVADVDNTAAALVEETYDPDWFV